MRSKSVRNISLSAMFIALGMVLPFLTGQIPQFGSMLLPMHLPVLLCGLICGAAYGGAVGFILPLLRYAVFHMPPIYPVGLAMAFELATYGLVIGFIYSSSKRKTLGLVYSALLISMIFGRVVWGLAQMLLLGLGGKAFSLQMFMAGAFINAVPGIILQLILIPIIMRALESSGLLKEV